MIPNYIQYYLHRPLRLMPAELRGSGQRRPAAGDLLLGLVQPRLRVAASPQLPGAAQSRAVNLHSCSQTRPSSQPSLKVITKNFAVVSKIFKSLNTVSPHNIGTLVGKDLD